MNKWLASSNIKDRHNSLTQNDSDYAAEDREFESMLDKLVMEKCLSTQQERYDLCLSYAMPTIQWASNRHCHYDH